MRPTRSLFAATEEKALAERMWREPLERSVSHRPAGRTTTRPTHPNLFAADEKERAELKWLEPLEPSTRQRPLREIGLFSVVARKLPPRPGFNSHVALLLARTQKRVALKYGEKDRLAESIMLEERALAAIKEGKPYLPELN